MMEEKARTKMTMAMGTAVHPPRVAATASEVRVPAAAEGLDETLLDGVGDGRGGGREGSGALPGLVGEQAAAGSVGQGGDDAAGDPSGEGSRPEGRGHNGGQKTREPGDVEGDDDDGHDHVDQGHDGRHPLGDASDPAHSAEDDES